MPDIEIHRDFDLMTKVIDAYGKGHNATEIAKIAGIKRGQVLDIMADWKVSVLNSDKAKADAKEALARLTHSYDVIMKKMWEVVEQVDSTGDYKTKASTLKSLADIEAKKVDILQKAGLYDDAAMGDQLADMEEKHRLIIEMIKDVSLKCPNCKFEMASRLGKLTNESPEIIPGYVVQNRG